MNQMIKTQHSKILYASTCLKNPPMHIGNSVQKNVLSTVGPPAKLTYDLNQFISHTSVKR